MSWYYLHHIIFTHLIQHTLDVAFIILCNILICICHTSHIMHTLDLEFLCGLESSDSDYIMGPCGQSLGRDGWGSAIRFPSCTKRMVTWHPINNRNTIYQPWFPIVYMYILYYIILYYIISYYIILYYIILYIDIEYRWFFPLLIGWIS